MRKFLILIFLFLMHIFTRFFLDRGNCLDRRNKDGDASNRLVGSKVKLTWIRQRRQLQFLDVPSKSMLQTEEGIVGYLLS